MLVIFLLSLEVVSAENGSVVSAQDADGLAASASVTAFRKKILRIIDVFIAYPFNQVNRLQLSASSGGRMSRK